MTVKSILTALFLAAAVHSATVTGAAAERLGSLVVAGKTIPLSKSDIIKATWGLSSGFPVVKISFSPAMTLKLCKLTADNISKQMVLKVRGTVIVDAVIVSKICSGNMEVTGRFTMWDVKKIAKQLQGQ